MRAQNVARHRLSRHTNRRGLETRSLRAMSSSSSRGVPGMIGQCNFPLGNCVRRICEKMCCNGVSQSSVRPSVRPRPLPWRIFTILRLSYAFFRQSEEDRHLLAYFETHAAESRPAEAAAGGETYSLADSKFSNVHVQASGRARAQVGWAGNEKKMGK